MGDCQCAIAPWGQLAVSGYVRRSKGPRVKVGVGGVCVFVFETVSSELLDSSGGSKLPRPFFFFFFFFNFLAEVNSLLNSWALDTRRRPKPNWVTYRLVSRRSDGSNGPAQQTPRYLPQGGAGGCLQYASSAAVALWPRNGLYPR
jgi:hypothetical protein